mgnify:FL=1
MAVLCVSGQRREEGRRTDGGVLDVAERFDVVALERVAPERERGLGRPVEVFQPFRRTGVRVHWRSCERSLALAGGREGGRTRRKEGEGGRDVGVRVGAAV